MHFISETVVDGVLERAFEIEVAGERVPGVIWSPANASRVRALVLMGHGGGQHKQAPGVVARARSFVTTLQIAAVAIDAPGHGDRAPSAETAQLSALLKQKISEGKPIAADVGRENARQAARMVPEWQATLDALQTHGVVEANVPAGYWGMSMGGAIGVQLLAAEPRIGAAVLGLIGLIPEQPELAAAAARVSVPIEFVVQWGDELVSRDASFALFDAFGSQDKSLHANPGGHVVRLPAFETESWQRFFQRHLLG